MKAENQSCHLLGCSYFPGEEGTFIDQLSGGNLVHTDSQLTLNTSLWGGGFFSFTDEETKGDTARQSQDTIRTPRLHSPFLSALYSPSFSFPAPFSLFM